MTIRDVAKQAGVSIATVSRVLNGSDKVSPEAKQAVEQAMTALNYQKPAVKRRKPTKLFAVIVRNMTNPFFAQLVDVLEDEAYKHGRSILLFNSRNNLQLEKTFLSECVNHKVDGVFLIPRSLKPQHLADLDALPFPVVLLTATSSQTASIGTNHRHGGELVAKYFVEQGYHRIGFIGASDKLSDRFIGFTRELERLGRELPEQRVLAPYTSQSLQAFISREIAQQDTQLEAVFCSDDICASHLYNAMKAMEIARRKQVEVVGFDDTFIAQSLGFSSVRQPMKQIALLGFDKMIAALQDGELEQSPTLLEPTLVVRHAPAITALERAPEILRSE